MDYKIANVKVSIKTSAIVLDNVITVCSEKQLYCKNYNNFLVVKDIYTYIIFKQNKNNQNHINITKIPNIDSVSNAITRIQDLTKSVILSQNIDNIIASTSWPKQLNLKQISTLFTNVKYNNEKFPGLFIKFPTGTVILFHSGKIVIVGCKNEKDLQCLIQKIFARM
ncbi:hypothetical protein [Flavobacterium sp.]|jgi:hypothetical protein|uniref:hypothetical protein n=1 Tax=Flavobacterium sp. TaxID=239 RepID=UPI003341C152